MRYSFISAAVLAFSSAVLAQEATPFFDVISVPANLQAVPVDSTLTITWDPTTPESVGTQTVDIYLLQGASQGTLQLAAAPLSSTPIVNSQGSYAWTVDASVLGSALYGFKLVDTSNPARFQYSFPFSITGSVSSSSSSSIASATATTTVQIATGSAYTSTSSVPTISSAPVVQNATNGTTTAISSATASSNGTVTLVTSKKHTSTATVVTSTGTSTTAPLEASANAAMAKVANGGIALAGAALIAFAL